MKHEQWLEMASVAELAVLHFCRDHEKNMGSGDKELQLTHWSQKEDERHRKQGSPSHPTECRLKQAFPTDQQNTIGKAKPDVYDSELWRLFVCSWSWVT